MKQPDVQEKYKYTGLGLFTAHSAPQDVLELAKRETTQMAKILKAAGITPE